MTFKTVGLIFCAMGIVAGGWYIGERIKRSQKDLLFLLRLIEHVYGEIRYTRSELPCCYLTYKGDDERRIAGKMARGAYAEALSALSLSKEIKREMLSQLPALGSGTLDEELMKIERIREYLKKESEKAAGTVRGSVRSARVLGVCIAAAILLLFL